MAAKSPSRKWMDVQVTIAAVSMTAVLVLWNMFAAPDKSKSVEKAALEQVKSSSTPTEMPPATAMATMPPSGYTILFGGEAPKPQIIVQQPRGGGGGGDAGSSPVTSTGSS